MDRLSQITMFNAVVERQGFTAAAKMLGVTASAVSKQVSQLENELGARLINRTTRSLSLTEVGAAYYEQTKDIVTALERAETVVTELTGKPRGLLRVHIPVGFGQIHLSGVLPGFLARYPEVTLDVTVLEDHVDLVEAGIDAAVRIGGRQDSSLIRRRLAPNRRLLCASPAYLAAHGTPETPGDLARHNCLTHSPEGPHGEWVFTDGGHEHAVRLRGSVRTNSFAVLRDAALAGAGIVRLAGYLIGEDLRAGRLISVLDQYVAQDAEISVVYPTRRHLSPKVRAFVDYLVETIGQPEFWRHAGLT